MNTCDNINLFVVYVTMLQVTQTIQGQMIGQLVDSECEWMQKDQLWHNLGYYHSFCLDGMRRILKHFSQDTLFLGCSLNPGPLKQKASYLTAMYDESFFCKSQLKISQQSDFQFQRQHGKDRHSLSLLHSLYAKNSSFLGLILMDNIVYGMHLGNSVLKRAFFPWINNIFTM